MVEDVYRVIARGKSGFDVEMAKADGRRKIVPGFRSEHEANAWIVQAKRMIRDASPWTPLAPRKPAVSGVAEAPPQPIQSPTEPQVVQGGEGAPSRRVRAGRERATAKP
jgi:hypothetical protein